MSRTRYDEENGELSQKGHLCAQKAIYPKIFSAANRLEFIDTRLEKGEKEKILDGEMAVDRLILSYSEYFDAPIQYTVQERFRRIPENKYTDITVTQWNTCSNKPSELHKLNAGIFVYGFFDEEANEIPHWLAVNTVSMLLGIESGAIKWYTAPPNNKGQLYLCVDEHSLAENGCIIRSKDWPSLFPIQPAEFGGIGDNAQKHPKNSP